MVLGSMQALLSLSCTGQWTMRTPQRPGLLSGCDAIVMFWARTFITGIKTDFSDPRSGG